MPILPATTSESRNGFPLELSSRSDVIETTHETAQDVFDLVQAVRARVRDSFGVKLEPEIRFAGAFGSSVARSEAATGP